jgi:hypothetical protein
MALPSPRKSPSGLPAAQHQRFASSAASVAIASCTSTMPGRSARRRRRCPATARPADLQHHAAHAAALEERKGGGGGEHHSAFRCGRVGAAARAPASRPPARLDRRRLLLCSAMVSRRCSSAARLRAGRGAFHGGGDGGLLGASASLAGAVERWRFRRIRGGGASALTRPQLGAAAGCFGRLPLALGFLAPGRAALGQALGFLGLFALCRARCAVRSAPWRRRRRSFRVRATRSRSWRSGSTGPAECATGRRSCSSRIRCSRRCVFLRLAEILGAREPVHLERLQFVRAGLGAGAAADARHFRADRREQRR